MSLHGELVKRQQWCIPCPDTTVALKYTEFSMYLLCLRFLFSHFLLFASLKIQTHTFPKFKTSHQWLLTYENVPQTKFFFCVWKPFRKWGPQNDKKNNTSAQKKQGSIQPVKATQPRSLQRYLQLQNQDHIWILLCAALRIQILTKNNSMFFLFWSSSEMHTCKEKYRCTDEWYSITVMLRSQTRT